MRVRPNRLKKEQWVQSFRQEILQYPAVLLLTPQGLTAREDLQVRRRIKALQAHYRVVKNRLARLAFQGTPLEPLSSALRGMTAVAYHTDGVALAKLVRDLMKEYSRLAFKAAVVEGQLFTDKQLDVLVHLPSREVARAQVLGLLQGPAARVVRLLAAPLQQFLAVLHQYQARRAGEPDSEGGSPMAELTKEQVIEYLSGLTVTQLIELVKDLEQRWGVQAAAAVPMAVPVAGGAPAAAAEEEKVITYSVVIKDAGQQKVQLIKVLREIFPELGLKEAKALVDAAPKTIKEGLTREEAEDLKKKLEQAGATVEITSK